MAKSLFIFLFFWTYYTRMESVGKYHMTKVIVISHVTSHKVVT